MLQGDRDMLRREREWYRQLEHNQAEGRRLLLGARDAPDQVRATLQEREAASRQAMEALRLEREAFEQEKQAAVAVAAAEGPRKKKWWKWLSRK